MAENRNDYFDMDGGEFGGLPGEDAQRDNGRGFSVSGSVANKQMPQMPPRNVLETDSAKYTAEYIKEVVKGLYTVDASAYANGEKEVAVSAGYKGYDNDRGSSERYEKTADAGLNSLRQTRVVERNVSGPVAADEDYENRTETRYTEKEPEWAPEWKSENPRERQFAQPQERASSVRYEYRQETNQEHSEKQGRDQAAPFKDVQHSGSNFHKEDFLKAFEEKSRQDFYVQSQKAPRKTFNKNKADGNTAELEQVLSGKSSKKVSSGVIADRNADIAPVRERAETAVAFEQHTFPAGSGVVGGSEIEPKEDYVYLRDISKEAPANEYMTQTAMKADNFRQAEVEQERIPIIINKSIEGKAKKTAEDYNKMANRSGYDKAPFRKMEPVAHKSGGAKIFAALLMALAIIIISFLVWKITSLTEEAKIVQSDAEMVAQLEAQIRSLSQRNSELEYELEQRDMEIDALRSERQSNTENDGENIGDEQEQSSEEPSSAQSHPDLVDGYYTVQRGDTLWKISEKFLGSGYDYQKIAAANNFDSSQSLSAGMKLKIPTE